MLQSFAKSFHLLLSFPEVSDGGNGWRLRWAFVYMYRALGGTPLGRQKHEDASGNQG